MIKLFYRFLALLLAAALVLTASVWILSHTLGSTAYLEQHADSQNIYQQLADQLPGKPSVTALRSQIQDFLPKFFIAIGGTGPGEAITLPGTDTPITPVAPDSVLSAVIRTSGQLTWIGPAACIILILFIVAVGRAARWKILSAGFLQAAIGLALTAGVLWLSPGFVIQNMVTAGLDALKSAFEPFVTTLLHDIAWQFLWAALGALAIAVLLRAAHTVVGLARRFQKPKPASPPPPPTSNLPGRLQD
jgi:hypothetical protein